MISEREAALRHLQEGELVLRLLADRFQRSKSRLDESFENVRRVKESMEREGIETAGPRRSPTPPGAIMSDVGFAMAPADSPARSVSSGSFNGDSIADTGEESKES